MEEQEIHLDLSDIDPRLMELLEKELEWMNTKFEEIYPILVDTFEGKLDEMAADISTDMLDLVKVELSKVALEHTPFLFSGFALLLLVCSFFCGLSIPIIVRKVKSCQH